MELSCDSHVVTINEIDVIEKRIKVTFLEEIDRHVDE